MGLALEEAARALALLTGKEVAEEVVARVFQNFCVGSKPRAGLRRHGAPAKQPPAPGSVAEVAHAGEDHGDPRLLRRPDGVLVPHAPPGWMMAAMP